MLSAHDETNQYSSASTRQQHTKYVYSYYYRDRFRFINEFYVGGKGLLFSTNDKSLPWPITDARDMGTLLIHGPHCLKMIEMYNKQNLDGQPLSDIYDRLHSEHCRRLACRVLNYYQNEETNY